MAICARGYEDLKLLMFVSDALMISSILYMLHDLQVLLLAWPHCMPKL